MANARASQLTELSAGEVVSTDVFIIVDTANHETKKITVGSVSSYLGVSGSLTAAYALLAGTASYVNASNVIGSIPSSSFSNKSLTSSISDTSISSLTSISSSYSQTASVIIGSIPTAVSAAFLIHSATNGTASWADNVVLATNSTNASNLIYTGAPNGTASVSIISMTLSVCIGTSATASYLNPPLSGPSVATSSYAIVANNAYNADLATIAVSAQNSDFADTASIADSASVAITAINATNADNSTTSDTATNAILAETASYVLNTSGNVAITPNGLYVLSGSVVWYRIYIGSNGVVTASVGTI
jgi:hypothetical protein